MAHDKPDCSKCELKIGLRFWGASVFPYIPNTSCAITVGGLAPDDGTMVRCALFSRNIPLKKEDPFWPTLKTRIDEQLSIPREPGESLMVWARSRVLELHIPHTHPGTIRGIMQDCFDYIAELQKK